MMWTRSHSLVDLREKLFDFLVVLGVEHFYDHIPLGSVPQPLFRQEQQRPQSVLPVHNAEDVPLFFTPKLTIEREVEVSYYLLLGGALSLLNLCTYRRTIP